MLHRPALVPHPLLDNREGCWSGNTVRHEGAVVAFYPGFRRSHPYQPGKMGGINRLRAHLGPPQQVDADPSPGEHVLEFRDPFMWRHPDSWRMLVGSAAAARSRQHASTHRRTLSCRPTPGYKHRHPVTPSTTSTPAPWECLQLLQLAGEDVLLVGAYSPDRGIGKDLSLRGTAGVLPPDGPAVPRAEHVSRRPEVLLTEARAAT